MKKSIARRYSLMSLVATLLLPGAAAAQKLMVGYSGATAIPAPVWAMND